MQTHAANEAVFNRLHSVLEDRVKEPFDWREACAGESYTPEVFSPPPATFNHRWVRAEAALKRPLVPWMLLLMTLIISFMIVTDTRFRVVGGAMFLAAIVGVTLTLRSRNGLVSEMTERIRKADQERLASARVEYDRRENERRADFEARNQVAARLAVAVERADAEALAGLLEHELANEEVPMTFGI